MRGQLGSRGVDIQSLESRQLLSAATIGITSLATSSGTELGITGTSGNDSITVSRSGGGVLVTSSGGFSKTIYLKLADIRVDAMGGNDRVVVSTDLKMPVELFGGDGNDTLYGGGGNDSLYGGAGHDYTDGRTGNDTLVDVGGSIADRAVGGLGEDSFWIDADKHETILDLSSSESAAGAMHRISGFANCASVELNGVALSDPSLSTGATHYKLFNQLPLFSTSGPSADDVAQGQLGDCYLLASLASIANTDSAALRQRIVDLGDGTYAVQFTKGKTQTYVRIDADLPVTARGSLAYAQVGNQDCLWVALFEKAYAFYRDGSHSYAAIEGGFMGDVYEDFGLPSSSLFDASDGRSLLRALSTDLSDGKAVTLGTKTNTGSLPVIGGHAYVVDRVICDSKGNPTSVQLTNPWGVDGAGNDGADDGKITLTADQALQVFWFACVGG